MNAAGLVESCQSALVVLALVRVVGLDVPLVSQTHSLDGPIDLLDSILSSHTLGGEVGVGACAVPTLDGFWVQGDIHSVFLSYAVQQESADPKIVTSCDAQTGPNLVLPLGGHHFGVGATNGNTSIQAGTIVGLNNFSGYDFVGTNAAVVGTLGAREAIFGPAQRLVVGVKKSVFLLDAKPGLFVFDGVHGFFGLQTLVGGTGGVVEVEGLAEDQDVVATAKGVLVDGDGDQVDLAVLAMGLEGGTAVVCPDGEIYKIKEFIRVGFRSN